MRTDAIPRAVRVHDQRGYADVPPEVESAAGGLPQSLTPSLSALANLPGGGRVILGLDEATGFTPVGLADPQALKQALGSVCRADGAQMCWLSRVRSATTIGR